MEGGCGCGAVRYRLIERPMFVNCCHCTWCQRETGSAFAINAILEPANVAILQGAPEPVTTPSASGRGQVIWRCPTCRVALWSNYGGRGDLLRFVRVGTLDKPHPVVPNAHIFTSSKVPWLDLGDAIPAFEEYYDTKALWPPMALARRRAALDAFGRAQA